MLHLSLGRDARSLKSNVCCLSEHSRETSWASLCWSRLGETRSLGRENQSSPLFSRAFTLHRSQMAQIPHMLVHITYQTYPNDKTEAQPIWLKRKRANPSFPYLERVIRGFDTGLRSTTARETDLETGKTAEQWENKIITEP